MKVSLAGAHTHWKSTLLPKADSSLGRIFRFGTLVKNEFYLPTCRIREHCFWPRRPSQMTAVSPKDMRIKRIDNRKLVFIDRSLGLRGAVLSGGPN